MEMESLNNQHQPTNTNQHNTMKALKAYRELKDCLVKNLQISESEARQRIITQIHYTEFDKRQDRRKA
jgi:hypothetical protein